jgi:hypothetical protein
MRELIVGVLMVILFTPPVYASKVSNEMIYRKLLEMEKRQAIMEVEFKVFRKQVDERFDSVRERFDSIDKRFDLVKERFDSIDKRFDMVDKRFEELREDMNKRFELMDKRFEAIDKRFEEQLTFLEIVTVAFSTIAAATIGFAIWDRRTFISKAKEETLKELKTDEKMKEFITALRNLAERDKEVAKLLKQFHLL